MLNKNYLAFYKLKNKQIAISIIYFLLLILLYRTESILKINTHYLGTDRSDGGLYVWLFKSNLKDLWALPWFNTRAFYPYTLSLGWSDSFILPALVAKPFVLMGLPIIVAYNAILLLATFLNGLCTFKVAFQLSNHFIGSLISGTVMLGLPFLVLHLGHPQLQFVFWIPLAIGLYCKFLNQPKFISAFLLGLTLFLSFLTTVYYTIFLIVTLLIVTLGFLIYQKNFFSFKNFSIALSGSLIGFAPIIPFALPYLDVKATYGERDLRTASAFGANILSYLSAPASNLFFSFSAKWSHSEALLFPGIICLTALLIILTNLNQRNPRWIILCTATSFIIATCLQVFKISFASWFFWLTFFGLLYYCFRIGQLSRKLKINYVSNQGLIAVLLFTTYSLFFWSLGPLGVETSFFNNSYSPQGIHTIFYHLIPGVSAIRAVSRMGILVAFFLSLLIPFAFQRLDKIRLISRIFLPLSILAWTVLENYPKYYPLENEHRAQGIFAELNNFVAKDDVVIGLPMTSEELRSSKIGSWRAYSETSIEYQNWLLDQQVMLVNGYSGQQSKNAYELPWVTQSFPSEESLNTLGLIAGLKWIIFASHNQPSFNQQIFESKLAAYQDRLQIIKRDELGNYLIKLINATPLTLESYLQVPSYPANSKLVFNLKANSPEKQTIFVSLFVKKYGEVIPWKQLNLIADNTWQEFTVNVPKTPDRVRPVSIRFKSILPLTLGENQIQ